MSSEAIDLEESLDYGPEYNAKCRICWHTGHKCELLSPCSCNGSQKYVHYECLSRWIAERDDSDRHICDVCRCQYNGITISYKKMSFIYWLIEGEEVMAHIILALVLLLFLFYIINIGAIQFILSNGHISDIIRYIQISLTVFFSFIFFVIVMIACGVCRMQFKEWQQNHFITIVKRDSRYSSRGSTVSIDSNSVQSVDTSVDASDIHTNLLSNLFETTGSAVYGSTN